MRLDLGVDPQRTIIGLVMFGVGVVLEVEVWTHLDTTPFWFAVFAPLVLGLGGGILLGQWHKTTRLRRVAREWVAAHPGENPAELAPEPPQHRGEPKPPKRPPVPAEDDPNWSTYAQSWVDNPEKPTDEPGGMGDHD